MKSSSTEAKVDWKKLAGHQCDFQRYGFVNPGWERGHVKGTNNQKGVLENVIITDAAGNEVHIPVSVAQQYIVLLGL